MKFLLAFFCLISVAYANMGFTWPIPRGSTDETDVCSDSTDLTADPNPCSYVPTFGAYFLAVDDVCGGVTKGEITTLFRTGDDIELKVYQRSALGGAGNYDLGYLELGGARTDVKSWNQADITGGDSDDTELTLAVDMGDMDIGAAFLEPTAFLVQNASDEMYVSCFDFIYREPSEIDDCEFDICCRTVPDNDEDFCAVAGKKICYTILVAPDAATGWSQAGLDARNDAACDPDVICPNDPDSVEFCDEDGTFIDITKDEYCTVSECTEHADCDLGEIPLICYDYCTKCQTEETCDTLVDIVYAAKGETDCFDPDDVQTGNTGNTGNTDKTTSKSDTNAGTKTTKADTNAGTKTTKADTNAGTKTTKADTNAGTKTTKADTTKATGTAEDSSASTLFAGVLSLAVFLF